MTNLWRVEIAEACKPNRGDLQSFRLSDKASPDVTLAIPQLTIKGARNGTVWFDEFSAAEIESGK